MLERIEWVALALIAGGAVSMVAAMWLEFISTNRLAALQATLWLSGIVAIALGVGCFVLLLFFG